MDSSSIFQLLLLYIIFHVRVPSSSPAASRLHLFMNFRGEDTRHNFTSLLYHALNAAGFNVFLDEKSIATGKQIDSEIVEAINNSMGAIIIFSKGYASSTWCLDELVLILERKRQLGSNYLLLPIYVDGVQPGEIFSSYGKAIAKHNKWYHRYMNRDWQKKVKAWIAALKEVRGYKGRILDGNWAKFINDTVEDVQKEFIGLRVIVCPRTRPNTRKEKAGRFRAIHKLIKNLAILSIIISIGSFYQS